MNNQMFTASTTLSQLLKRLDTISHNIANVNTTGYKSKSASFHDVLQQVEQNHMHTNKEVGRSTPYGVNVGIGAKLSSITFSHEQGSIIQTGRDLDVTINGNWAYFRTMSTDGSNDVAYTRNGAFSIAENPNAMDEIMLVSASGKALLDNENNPISFTAPYEKLAISSKGEVTVIDGNGETQSFQLSLAKITRPDLLEAKGTNEFTLKGTAVENIANGTLEMIDLSSNGESSITLQQGALEMSNVNLTDEMTNLMTTQRMIQLQGRSISMADQMMGIANSIRG